MDGLIERVRLLLSQRRYADARTMLMDGLSKSPEDAELKILLAYCLCREGRAREALTLAEDALNTAPELEFCHYVRGTALLDLGDPRSALGAAKQALKISPYWVDGHSLRARIHASYNEWKESKDAAEEGLAADPNDTDCLGFVALADHHLGRYADSEAVLAKGLRREPENAWLLAIHGWNLLHVGGAAAALEVFRASLRIDPDQEYARSGAVEALKGRYAAYRMLFRYWHRVTHATYWDVLWLIPWCAIVLALCYSVERYGLVPLIGFFVLNAAMLVFTYAAWATIHISNVFLLYDSFGRAALSSREFLKVTVAALVTIGIAMIVGGYFSGILQITGLGILLFFFIPHIGYFFDWEKSMWRRAGTVLSAAALSIGVFTLAYTVGSFLIILGLFLGVCVKGVTNSKS